MNSDEKHLFGNYVVQYPMEYSFCAGCQSCEAICSLMHDGCVSPSHNRIFVERDIRSLIHTVWACKHCLDHPCYNACPKKDKAMHIDENGIVYIVEEECIGCGLCIKGCSMTPPRINLVKSKDRNLRKAKKCDLCRTREEGPACIEYCPSRCLGLSCDPLPYNKEVTNNE